MLLITTPRPGWLWRGWSALTELYGVSSAGMRFFSVYGPKERSKKQYANMVSQFMWDMMAGKTPVIYGDGSQTRDFVYVSDVVRAP